MLMLTCSPLPSPRAAAGPPAPRGPRWGGRVPGGGLRAPAPPAPGLLPERGAHPGAEGEGAGEGEASGGPGARRPRVGNPEENN